MSSSTAHRQPSRCPILLRTIPRRLYRPRSLRHLESGHKRQRRFLCEGARNGSHDRYAAIRSRCARGSRAPEEEERRQCAYAYCAEFYLDSLRSGGFLFSFGGERSTLGFLLHMCDASKLCIFVAWCLEGRQAVFSQSFWGLKRQRIVQRM